MTKTFRLQPVLKYRKIMEDKSRQELADSRNRQQSVHQALDGHRDRYRELNREFADLQEEGITAHELLLFHARLDRQKSCIRSLEQKAEHLDRETDHCQQKLREANRDRQLLDNLKDRYQQEKDLEIQRAEATMMDEIALKGGSQKI